MTRRTQFSAESARHLLSGACSTIGADPTDAKLLRLGENAIFILEKPKIVVRIARGMNHMADAEKEVRVADWLALNGIRAARLYPAEQPIDVNHHPVTFWEVIADSGMKVRAAELGSVLRSIHACPVSCELDLPALNMFNRVEARLESSDGIDSETRAFLRQRLHDLEAAFSQLLFKGDRVALHGDAHVKNLIQTPDSGSVLIDFEGFCLGPREIDLAVTATEYEVGWHSDGDYQSFCTAYGADVRLWPGFHVLRDANLLKMTTWLMQNIQESSEVAAEFERRLEVLHRPAKLANSAWLPF